jgi:predicted O-methyltransferase YrrM
MDPKVRAVIDEYQARADTEARWIRDPNRSRDEMLLPVGPATASLMSTIIRESQFKAILEVGSSYGYSTVWLAEAARATGGKLTTLELHACKVEYAKTRLARAELDDYVDFRLGDALETLQQLPGPFEFVLLDVWKELYVACFELIYPKLAPGALIVADNMLFPESVRADANAYRERVRSAPDITSVLLDVGSGIEVSRFCCANRPRVERRRRAHSRPREPGISEL